MAFGRVKQGVWWQGGGSGGGTVGGSLVSSFNLHGSLTHTNLDRGDTEPSAAQVSLCSLLPQRNKQLESITVVHFRGLEMYPK